MWTIKIHHLVIEEDLRKLDEPVRRKIIRTIRKKLSAAPAQYGEPLRGEFRKYWKLRIEDYRVIYRIIEDEILVLVVKVGIRKNEQVYREFLFRMKKVTNKWK